MDTPHCLLALRLLILAADAAFRHRERLLTVLDILAGVPELMAYFVLGGLEEGWAWIRRGYRPRPKPDLVNAPECVQHREERQRNP